MIIKNKSLLFAFARTYQPYFNDFFSPYFETVASGINRLHELESLIVNEGITNNNFTNSGEKLLSIETLLDALIVLYDECGNSSLRREKTVSDFIELSMNFDIYIAGHVHVQ